MFSNREDAFIAWNTRAESPEIATPREQVKALRDALEEAKMFIKNGLDLGYITPPEPDDPAYGTLNDICKVLEQTKPKDGE